MRDPCNTIRKFIAAHPDKDTAVQMIAVSELGEIAKEYFTGNEDSAHMGRFITDYVFVNSWTVSVKDIKIYSKDVDSYPIDL